ncbi:MAG: Asp-tRNA(Asn)/Glu-tRNA(Gln) amidotransferase subunit GatC [Fimbriimonadaceae bacterium]
MPLSREQVCQVAELARLELTEEEIEDFRSELGDILDYFELLEKLDLESVEEFSHVVDMVNRLADDVPAKSFDRDVALSNAPASKAGLILVPELRS